MRVHGKHVHVPTNQAHNDLLQNDPGKRRHHGPLAVKKRVYGQVCIETIHDRQTLN